MVDRKESVVKDEDCRHDDSDGSGPNAGVSDPRDGRDKYEWRSNYPPEATNWIWIETLILFSCFLLTVVSIFLVWRGVLPELLGVQVQADKEVFSRYAFYALGGLLGGTVFALKWLYRAVARGFWHVDRRPWRLLTPWVSFSVAFVAGTLIEGSLIGDAGPPDVSGGAIAVGFLSGYFADNMVAKMYEVANVLFGTVKSK